MQVDNDKSINGILFAADLVGLVIQGRNHISLLTWCNYCDRWRLKANVRVQ